MTFEGNNRNFKRCLDMGKKGEMMAARLLERLNFDVEDVSGDAAWQKRDVDFLGTKRGKTVRFEVKTDKAIGRTKNLCFESFIHRNVFGTNIPYSEVPGWLEYSEAHVFIMCDAVTGDLYLIKNKPDEIKAAGHKKKHMNYAEGNRDDLILLNIDKAAAAGLLIRKFNYYDFCMPDDELF